MAAKRSRSCSSARSLPVAPRLRIAPARMMPMITTTTRISRRVKPRPRRRRAGQFGAAVTAMATLARAASVVEVPVADVGVDALAPCLAVRAQRKQVVLPVGSRNLVLVIVAPRILVQVLEVAPGTPVADVRVVRLLHQRLQSGFRRRVIEVVQLVHRQ